MKGDNPFVVWGEDPQNISGRKKEIKLFNTYLNAVLSRQPVGIAVTGGPGSGKSIFLERLKDEAEKKGFFCVVAKTAKNESAKSLLGRMGAGSRAVASAFVAERKLKKSAYDKLGKASWKDAASFFLALNKTVCPPFYGIIIFADDVDNTKTDIPGFLREGVKKAARKGSFSAVVSSKSRIRDDFFRELELGPFSIEDAEGLVGSAVGKTIPRFGSGCISTIHLETGGNPYLFKLVCWYLYEKLKGKQKVITKGHYLAYLPAIVGFLAAEVFEKMYSGIPEGEREVLRFLAKKEAANVSDIAKGMKKRLGAVTSLIMRLMEKGHIVKISRGRYSVYSRIYARYVLSIS